MKLGVITDGISRDLSQALTVMDEFGLDWAELQYIGDKEVGDLSETETADTIDLLKRHGKRVSCVSRHLFAGMTMGDAVPGGALHRRHMEALARCIDFAHAVDSPLVRIMTGRKEQILWGLNGAETWNVAHGAWEAQLPLIEPAVELARRHGIKLVVETGNGTMVNSAWMAVKLIDALDAADTLQVLWDPANACWAHERAWPDACTLLLEKGYLGHMHIKDVHVDTPKATLEVRPLGHGDLAEQLGPIASALREAQYTGGISYESVYHAGDGDFEAGFRSNIEGFLALFRQPS